MEGCCEKLRRESEKPRREPVRRIRPTQAQLDFFKGFIDGYRKETESGDHGSRVRHIKEVVYKAFLASECSKERQLSFEVCVDRSHLTRILSSVTWRQQVRNWFYNHVKNLTANEGRYTPHRIQPGVSKNHVKGNTPATMSDEEGHRQTRVRSSSHIEDRRKDRILPRALVGKAYSSGGSTV